MKDSQPKPSREFLSMIIIMLRKSQAETGQSLVSWLEHFEDENSDVDTYDDTQLRLAVSKLLKELHPEEPKPFDPADWPEDEEDDTAVVAVSDNPEELDRVESEIKAETEDDSETLPNVEKVED